MKDQCRVQTVNTSDVGVVCLDNEHTDNSLTLFSITYTYKLDSQ